jgi:hypothetical protein
MCEKRLDTMSHHASASATHVSESEPADSKVKFYDADKDNEAERKTDPVDKEFLVIEHVVGALLADKKRKLAQLIAHDLQVQAKPCVGDNAKRLELQRLAHQRWPQLEKELVRDITSTLCETRRAQAWAAREITALTLENSVLRARLAVVASAF